MQRVDGGKFRWPKNHEVEIIDSRNIMDILTPPVPKGTTRITFEFTSDDVKRMDDIFSRLWTLWCFAVVYEIHVANMLTLAVISAWIIFQLKNSISAVQ